MPTVGLEYRYPFISVQSGHVNRRADRPQYRAAEQMQAGKWPNEDAQNLHLRRQQSVQGRQVSGWDRVEGGGRANYGLTYTAHLNHGGALNVLFGQSYSLWGNCSHRPGTANAGLDSGLGYHPLRLRCAGVLSAHTAPSNSFRASELRQRQPCRQADGLEASANFDRWSTSLLYGNYAAQPDIGFLTERQGLLGSGSAEIDANWVLRGSALYDLNFNKLSSNSLGVAYVNDRRTGGPHHITNYSYGTGAPLLNHTVVLQLSLRTLGDTPR